jgi:hypothetical protein
MTGQSELEHDPPVTSPERPAERWMELRARGWASPLARLANGALLSLTLTGLAIFLLPFSVFNQHGLLVHTALGLLVLPALAVFVRHVRDGGLPAHPRQFTGWVAGGMAAVCCVSGVVLSAGALGTPSSRPGASSHRRPSAWLFLIPHIVAVALPAPAGRVVAGAAAARRALGPPARRRCGAPLRCRSRPARRWPCAGPYDRVPLDHDANATATATRSLSLARTATGGPSTRSLAGGLLRHGRLPRGDLRWLPAPPLRPLDAGFSDPEREPRTARPPRAVAAP